MTDFGNSSYTVYLKRSKGLGDGVMGYGIRFIAKDKGPTVLSLVPNGEASRSGLISEGDVLISVDGASVEGMSFSQVGILQFYFDSVRHFL
jgi:C-terminal processing protease CtpA/Prc